MMARKTNPKQYAQIEKWKKEHMRSVSAQYNREFVESFKSACSKLGLKQSDVFREAMQEIIIRANKEDL